MRLMEKKAGLILGGILLFSLVLVGVVMATSTTQTSTASVTVNTFLSVTIDDSTLVFGDLNPSAVNNKPTDDPLRATIGGETNINVNVRTRANDANFVETSNESLTFPISNLKWSAIDFSGTVYTQSDETVCSSLSANDFCDVYHELTIPSNQAAGTYDLAITISVVALV